MLPALVDPTDKHWQDASTTTPEQNLAMAVILMAIEDLQSKDEIDRFEAHEFFLQPKGPWADSRRYYFDACGLDDAHLLEHLSARLDPPERPAKKWDYMQVLEILPTDRAFTCPEMASQTSLHVSQFNTRIQNLIKSGDVVRLQPGYFCVTAFEPEYREQQRLAQMVIDLPEPSDHEMGGKTPGQNKVLNALRDGPLTAREIQIATETGGWDMLRGMVLNGLLVKDGTKYQIAPQTSVAA